MLFINGYIQTMEKNTYPRGFLQIQNGKITALGTMQDVPEDSDTVDVHGQMILPGFIDSHCHLGMWEDGLGFEGDDGNESTDPVTPQLRAIDAINPLDRTFAEARLGGVTTVLTGPGSANAIGGQWAAIKTVGCRIEDMLIDPAIGMKFALGENPKVTYNEKNTAPMTRMATAALIREQLRKAQRYLEDKKLAEEDEDFDEPEYDSKCEALAPVLERKQKAFFHAHRADDIFTAIRIAKEFQLDLVLVHATEGYLVRDTLAAEGVSIITGPILCDRSKPELRNLSVEGISLLHRSGICAALCTDHPVIPIQYLPLSAGIAIGAGLPREEALKSITIYAAKAAGIDARVGSLKEGKDADVVFYRDDPLTPYSHPEAVYINGEKVLS